MGGASALRAYTPASASVSPLGSLANLLLPVAYAAGDGSVEQALENLSRATKAVCFEVNPRAQKVAGQFVPPPPVLDSGADNRLMALELEIGRRHCLPGTVTLVDAAKTGTIAGCCYSQFIAAGTSEPPPNSGSNPPGTVEAP
jgi:hypothetical protein